MQDLLTNFATICEIAIAAITIYGALTHKPKTKLAIEPQAESAIEVEAVEVVEPAPAVSRIEELKAKFGTTLTAKAPIAPHLTAADVETALTLLTAAPQSPTVEELQDLGIRELRKLAKGKCPGLATATKAKLIAAIAA
ncbi:hypothetical protein [Pantanalinema sp. GBBB05]|uniref:hypothetical protein n=1 Tax=Pantanalinema sp. GBBB05 TaxID=2604139 RepID=UPI001D28E552|nr:hypothetical protein [Pantanalinema sp. GBBB05]